MNVTDRRRVLAPANTIYPTVVNSNQDHELSETEAIQEKRAGNEIRKFFLKSNLVQNANGSAYLEVGNTIIEVSVYGPRPIKGSFVERASFSVDTKFMPYINQPHELMFNSQNQGNKLGATGSTVIEHKISNYVETSFLPSILLERYGKSSIDLFISILSTDEDVSLTNLISWVINCASLALADADIEMKDIVSSGQVRLVLDSDEVIYDAVSSNEEKKSVECVASFMTLRNDEIVGIWFEGSMVNLDEKIASRLIDECNNVSKTIRSNINYYLINETA